LAVGVLVASRLEFGGLGGDFSYQIGRRLLRERGYEPGKDKMNECRAGSCTR
jgi:hypothetical protein